MSDGAIIDGRAIAAALRADVARGVSDFVRERGRPPGLAVVLVGSDPASETYVRGKKKAAAEVGVRTIDHTLAETTPGPDLLALVDRLNADDAVDGILVQLPLPRGFDEGAVMERIDPRKDADGFHPHNVGRLVLGRLGLVPCTPRGILKLIDSTGVSLEGKEAVVVGRSAIVGKPVAQLLLARHLTVTVAHSRTRDLSAVVGRAEILVAAVGKAELIRGDWVRPGSVVIDVGVNRRADGSLVGDVEFSAARARAGFISPVPGGVGPMTIACLLENTLLAARARVS